MRLSRPPDQRRNIGAALFLLALVLAVAVPTLPFLVYLTLVVVGAVLILSTLPWSRP